MAEATLRFCVRTPQGIAFEAGLRSLRVPTDTGQVGLRPRAERTALGVEPGLVLAGAPDGLRFVATAGGLLRCEGSEAVLLTPLAVSGESAPAVRAGRWPTRAGAGAPRIRGSSRTSARFSRSSPTRARGTWS